MKRSTFSLIAGSALLSGSTVATASAQSYPSKPVVLISWSAAGSPMDIMEREIAKLAPKYLGQPAVVEDRTGGGTANAIADMLSSPPDGYTVLGVTDALIVALNSTFKDQFKLDQFDFIGQLVGDPYVIAVRAASPLKTFADLVKAAKTSNLTIAGAFAVSNKSLFAQNVAATVGFKFQWVPYDGSSTATVAALGGHVDAECANVSEVASYVRSGEFRVLAVSTAEPIDALPGVPTFAALGHKNLTTAQWRGFAVRTGLPPDVRAKLVAFTKQVAADADFKSYCAEQNLVLAYADPVVLAKTVASGDATVRKLLASGIGSQ